MVSPTPFRASEFKSNYGPKLQYQPNLGGLTLQKATRLGFRSAAFGAAAGVALLFYASGIPRVQNDILKKIPGAAPLFTKEVHPADNPF